MITWLCHQVISLYYAGVRKSFEKSLDQLEATQRQRLQEIIQNLQGATNFATLSPQDSYEVLVQKIQPRSYQDLKGLIEEQKTSGKALLSSKIIRYEPTSGSTEARKWIPYSKDFLNEINKAAAAWLGDIYHSHPRVSEGPHYWSLSWLPEELREFTSSDDADLFPLYQRWILKQTMAVSSQIAGLKNPEAAWWASLISLAACEKLTLVSVWSPTFWLKITHDLQENGSEIATALQQGRWGRYEKEIETVLGAAPRRRNLPQGQGAEFFAKLWPRLTLISAWDSSSSTLWANKIKDLFPQVNFQGKGLWATEGVLSIPFQNKKVLALQSHFYEFRDLHSREILPSWKLQQGREYQPLLWTSSGLLRYPLQDRVQVTGFLKQTPCLEFKGRLQSVDLVGEKMDALWVQQLFDTHPEWQAICLVACHQPQPVYVLAHESESNIDIETELLKLHHYRVARELGQLQPARSLAVNHIFDFFAKTRKSQILGQNKIEVLLEVDCL